MNNLTLAQKLRCAEITIPQIEGFKDKEYRWRFVGHYPNPVRRVGMGYEQYNPDTNAEQWKALAVFCVSIDADVQRINAPCCENEDFCCPFDGLTPVQFAEYFGSVLVGEGLVFYSALTHTECMQAAVLAFDEDKNDG